MNDCYDYRKTLALIAPGIVAADAEVWMSDRRFERLWSTLEKVIALGVEFELHKAVETSEGLDLQYRAYGSGPEKMEADRLMSQLYND